MSLIKNESKSKLSAKFNYFGQILLRKNSILALRIWQDSLFTFWRYRFKSTI